MRWRRRPGPSALTAIGGFSVAIAVLSVAITASVVLLMPDPPAIRMTVAEAAAALSGTGSETFERSVGDPPEGANAPLLRPVLARAIGRPPSQVRVAWLEAPPARRADGGVVVFTKRSGFGPPPRIPGTLVLRGDPTRVRIARGETTDDLMSAVLLRLPQPGFAASVRQADGRWLTVRPRVPVLSGWRIKVLAALAASLGVLAPLAWIFARRLTRPFRRLATAIEEGRDPPQEVGPRELQDAARAILQMRARLAADSEERMRMLTAVAHDLRTPLTGLRLRIEGVAEPARSRMTADADRMGAMIADVLDFARTADAPRRAVSVRDVAAAVVADHAGVSLDDGPDLQVRVVEPAFRRAIENLVRNALDYAGGGRIAIVPDGDRVRIDVIDAGPGIDPAERDRLLRPFERGDASRNRDTGGVGLGLSIVRSFAELHDGDITLADAPGRGTIATLTLPRA